MIGNIIVCYSHYYDNCCRFLGHFTKYMHMCHATPFTLIFKKHKSHIGMAVVKIILSYVADKCANGNYHWEKQFDKI